MKNKFKEIELFLSISLCLSVSLCKPSVLVSSSGPGARDLPSRAGGPNGYFSVKHVKTVIFPGAPTPRPGGLQLGPGAPSR